jgi:hypothetical protein
MPTYEHKRSYAIFGEVEPKWEELGMIPQNPFPGMNPYLEGRADVHTRLASYAADMLQESLPSDLRARLEERVFIESFDERRAIRPDVYVFEERPSSAQAQSSRGGVAVAEPIMLPLHAVEVSEHYVSIIDALSGGRVVTMIEFISTTNKRSGPGRKLYLQKQHEAMHAGVHLVEVDLNRFGEPVSIATSDLVPPTRRALYHVRIWRGDDPQRVAYYPMSLRERLPVIPIPLRPTDSEVLLDLQSLIDLVYSRGRYDDIDYSRPVDPPLDPSDATWVEEITRNIS